MKLPTVSSSFDAFKAYSDLTRLPVTIGGLITFARVARCEWAQSKVAPKALAEGVVPPSRVSAAWDSRIGHIARAGLAGAVVVGALGLCAKDLKLIK